MAKVHVVYTLTEAGDLGFFWNLQHCKGFLFLLQSLCREVLPNLLSLTHIIFAIFISASILCLLSSLHGSRHCRFRKSDWKGEQGWYILPPVPLGCPVLPVPCKYKDVTKNAMLAWRWDQSVLIRGAQIASGKCLRWENITIILNVLIFSKGSYIKIIKMCHVKKGEKKKKKIEVEITRAARRKHWGFLYSSCSIEGCRQVMPLCCCQGELLTSQMPTLPRMLWQPRHFHRVLCIPEPSFGDNLVSLFHMLRSSQHSQQINK